MKVFEDILVELKEENLLEETVDLLPISNGNGNGSLKFKSKNGNGHKNGSSSKKHKGTAKNNESTRKNTNATSHSDRIAALQFVDFVISSAERLDGAAGLPFDELQVQKALHRYTQVGSNPESDEYFEAEATLVDSLRAWENDLVSRDANLPVGTLRRYTETANPPLSPQTLFALVRFYRSVPESENTYSKFDFVVTRLFSKFVDGEHRDMLCPRSDVVKHLNHRYSQWAMNDFKSLPADDPDNSLLCVTFDDFAAEAENASSLSGLIDAKFFERLFEFKQNSGEKLFVPNVTAAEIESNLNISRKIFELVSAQSEHIAAGSVDLDPELVSNAIARTFELKQSGNATPRALAGSGDESHPVPIRIAAEPRPAKSSRKSRSGRSSLFGINRWLLTATILSVAISVGLYIWSQYGGEDTSKGTVAARVVNLEKPELNQYIKTAKISGDTLFVVVTPQFTDLGQDKRKSVVQQVRDMGETKAFRRVTFSDADGKTIGFASADRIDIK